MTHDEKQKVRDVLRGSKILLESLEDRWAHNELSAGDLATQLDWVTMALGLLVEQLTTAEVTDNMVVRAIRELERKNGD